MRYLTASDLIRFNEIEVGPNLLANFGLLESAALRPQQTLFGMDAYPDLHTKAAALMHSLIRNHPFLDGNKRTAVLAALVFYNMNGHELDIDPEVLITLTLDVANGRLGVKAIANILQGWVKEFRYP